ncbi:hypothetical protein SAMN04487851_11417 [Prevotella sp. tc2-28]|uniref:hypothetical protein n=1 Tax=Prevotella sp. tc2-28 TaxID=1761888 RepID=UPI00089B35F9|nr:hypothetical protein [Prevotella sp. tc2-28]SEA78697.1 hypothetical protein SAMN04487851_11417 [Prevotella sp. tc2-28]
MDYEKKNKDAISTIKQALRQLATNGVPVGNIIEAIKDIEEKYAESEGERIRKLLIEAVIQVLQDQYCSNRGVSKEKVLAWLEKQGQTFTKKDVDDAYLKGVCDTKHELEKQGKQKPANEVEHKFNVGDFLVSDYCMGKVVELTNDAYLLDTEQGIPFSCEHNAHIWTIQDAKDGDVLFTSSTASHETFIFKGIDEKGNTKCYFSYDSEDGFREGIYHFIGRATNCKPATKEQRDLLFKKMHEAGYEWDAEKKELKKIEQKKTPIEGEFPYDNPSDTLEGEIENIWGKLSSGDRFSATKEGFREVITHFVNYIKEQDDWKLVEQKPAWSEEDDIMAHDIDYALRCQITYPISRLQSMSTWINNLKERVQPNPAWSEEDRRMLIGLIDELDAIMNKATPNEISVYSKYANWLNSIKDRVGCKVNCTTTKQRSEEMGKLFLDAISLLRDYASGVDKNSQLGKKIGRADAFLSDLYHNAFYPSTHNMREDLRKAEWSKEDEYYYGIIQHILNNEWVKEIDEENAINWFKSLKERYIWKPSDEQMKALEHAINCYSGVSPTNTEEVYTLEIMKEQLKKLREE